MATVTPIKENMLCMTEVVLWLKQLPIKERYEHREPCVQHSVSTTMYSVLESLEPQGNYSTICHYLMSIQSGHPFVSVTVYSDTEIIWWAIATVTVTQRLLYNTHRLIFVTSSGVWRPDVPFHNRKQMFKSNKVCFKNDLRWRGNLTSNCQRDIHLWQLRWSFAQQNKT